MSANKVAGRANVDDSFLSMDPDQIFVSKNITEIKELIRTMQNETDRKREELRSLVGERYRDLMEAAETIIGMRDTSAEAVDKLRSVQSATSTLSSLNVKLGANLRPKLGVDSECDGQYSLAAQIKLLMDVPERVWSSVESLDFLTAAKLYLFARHVHTNLSLNDEIMASYPVIDRQWAAISHFHETICGGCEAVLVNLNSTTDSAVEAMTALILLNGFNQKAIFDDLLKNRKTELSLKLKRQDVSAKAHINNSLASITSFLSTVYSSFMEGHLGVKIKSATEERTISLLSSIAESPVMDFLPSIIRDFKPAAPSSEKGPSPLSQSYIAEECTKWLDNIHEILTKETSTILSHVHNITGLSYIRKSVHSQMKEEQSMSVSQWNTMCEAMLGHKLNLWEEFFRHLFRDRVECIVSTQVAGSFYYLQSSLSNLPQKDDESVVDFMMSEVGLNENASIARSGDHESNVSMLTLKARAFSPSIQTTCAHFNEMLEAALKDLDEFIKEGQDEEANKNSINLFQAYLSQGEDSGIQTNQEPFALDSDNEFILKCLQQCVVRNIQDFVGYISKHSKELSKISVGRLLQALPELCPALKTSTLAPRLLMNQHHSDFDYMQYNHQTKKVAASKADPEWQEVKSKLEEQANDLFAQWVAIQVSELSSHLKSTLLNNAENTLAIMPTWDGIEISEESEDGTAMKSTIRVPQHLSISTYQAIAAYCKKVYAICPHSLPLTIQQCLSQNAALVVCQMYQEHCGKASRITQNLALQLHFDLQFVSLGMISRDRKDIEAICSETLTCLESHIDPFDLSVFTPYVSANVKKALLRHQSIFSVIIPSDRYALLASMKSSIPVTMPTRLPMQNGFEHNEHNVMLLSTSCARFALLPISSLSARGRGGRDNAIRGSNMLTASNLDSGASSTAKSSSTARKRSKSPVAKAANSFFEAMSTSWFGGK